MENIKHVESRKSYCQPFQTMIIRQFNCAAYVAGNLAEGRYRAQ